MPAIGGHSCEGGIGNPGDHDCCQTSASANYDYIIIVYPLIEAIHLRTGDEVNSLS
jgi:hypothetical protein